MRYKNPIVEGWYADPEARSYEGRYFIYATRSFTEYRNQMNLDAFSSVDLEHWKKHQDIIAMEDFPHVNKAVWAPAIIEKQGKYYLIFAGNDIQNNEEYGGLEIAVSDRPEGPFHGYLSHPLIDCFVNGAQPIDAHLFKDNDGVIYLYWGGWKHCNVAVMNEAMDGFIPFENGAWCKEITPPGYVEAPCMLKKGEDYYLMWSEGDWVNDTYQVSYCKSRSPLGPFDQRIIILNNQAAIAVGPGHNGYLYLPELDQWLIVYHRRLAEDGEAGHRVLCIDKMKFEAGNIEKITMTNQSVEL